MTSSGCRFADVSACKLIDAIRARRTTDMERFLIALGIPGIGPASARVLAERFRSLASLRRAPVEAIASVDGIGETTAAGVGAFFDDPGCVRVIDDLLDAGVRVTASPAGNHGAEVST